MLTFAEKTKVLEALRSGNYKQTRCKLYSTSYGGCYCALGLIASVLTGVINPYKIPELIANDLSVYDYLDLKLTKTVARKVEALNDNGYKPFSVIADYLENVWRQEEENL